MSTKWNTGSVIREAATEINGLDFSKYRYKLSKDVAYIAPGDPIEEVKEKILNVVWLIPSGAVSRSTETVISLLVEEAITKTND